MGDADINTLTIEKYLALSHGNQAPGMVKPKIEGNVNFEIKRYKNCRGAHLNKEYPLNEEVKRVEEVKYGEFGRPFPNNNENGARRAEMEDWIKKLQESTNLNTRNQNASLKNLETQIEHLFKDYQAKSANEVPNPSVGKCKVSKGTEEGPPGVLPCQLPPKELNLRSFTLPCIIGSSNLYAMADLGANVNIMPKSMFNHLKLTNLKETNMLVEMADMMKKAHVGIVENVLVKIDKFLFPFDFMIIDMLGVGEDIIIFDMNGNVHHPAAFVKKVYVVNEVQEEKPFNPLEIGDELFSYDSPLCLEI
ncbi:7-deoxyloganetin glucosyltransferase-like protein [Tanacetum coccineum]